MVGLRRDRKGAIAMFDALVFLFLLGMVATWLFAFGGIMEPEEPMAKTVSDDIFSMEVRTCDLMYLDDTKILPIETLISADMNSGGCGKLDPFLSATLEELIPEMYGYEFILEYGGHVIRYWRSSDRTLSSEYIEEHQIDGAGVLISTLRIY